MRMLNIASGSSGNATYIGTDNTHILVDAGLSRKKISEGLNKAGLTLKDIDGILITHEHIDHISGLGVAERTVEIPVYATAGTIRGIRESKSLGSFNTDMLREIRADEDFMIKDISIKALRTFHDAYDPVCYKLESGGKKAAVVTDLGCYTDYLLNNLTELDMILLEANHDIRMLEAGPYPYHLKKRILGEFGHLSNEGSGRMLCHLLHDKIKHIMLGHISRENNTAELAKLSVDTEIEIADNKYRAKDFDIRVARHDMASEIITC